MHAHLERRRLACVSKASGPRPHTVPSMSAAMPPRHGGRATAGTSRPLCEHKQGRFHDVDTAAPARQRYGDVRWRCHESAYDDGTAPSISTTRCRMFVTPTHSPMHPLAAACRQGRCVSSWNSVTPRASLAAAFNSLPAPLIETSRIRSSFSRSRIPRRNDARPCAAARSRASQRGSRGRGRVRRRGRASSCRTPCRAPLRPR